MINHDKSCGDGRKAESCGTFVVDNSIVTRFDFNPIRTKVDLVNTYNKCLRIIESSQVSESVTQIIAKILCWCRENLHVCNFGPITRDLELPPWAMSDKWTGTEFQPASARFHRKVYLVKCPETRLEKVHVKVDEYLSFMARLKAGQEVGHQNSYKEYTMDNLPRFVRGSYPVLPTSLEPSRDIDPKGPKSSERREERKERGKEPRLREIAFIS